MKEGNLGFVEMCPITGIKGILSSFSVGRESRTENHSVRYWKSPARLKGLRIGGRHSALIARDRRCLCPERTAPYKSTVLDSTPS